MGKIAFLFVIYDTIYQEDLWKHFFEGADPSAYSIYIHYKHNVPLGWMEPYKLKTCVETSYGRISVVRAENLLLKAALHDAQNEHFIFLSNSCIPVKSFTQIQTHLKPKLSYFNICHPQSCFPRCNSLLSYLPKEQIQKSSHWCILNRRHAAAVLEEDCTVWFEGFFGADEHYYITMLYRKNLQDELCITHDIQWGATTFCNWSEHDGNSPKTYHSITEEELQALIDSGSLFARKFAKTCSFPEGFRAWIRGERV
jgi:hypothetical protein